MKTIPFRITDPMCASGRYKILEKIFGKFLVDRRDLAYIRLMLKLSIIFFPMVILIFNMAPFNWYFAAFYLVMQIFYIGPFIIMQHFAFHRKFLKSKYKKFNFVISWIIGPIFGQTPHTYYAHHIGMHHPENNLQEDISSTLPYKRDSFRDFLRYLFGFYFTDLYKLSDYLKNRRRFKLRRRMFIGEYTYFLVSGVTLYLNWQAGLVVFILPFFMARFFMAAGNWGQHAFVDLDSPENNYRNSVNFVNAYYNKRCFNDGYHSAHHIKATMHWSEMPQEFMKDIKNYSKEKAIVFRGIDQFILYLLLMFKQYKIMAKFYLNLDPKNMLSKEDIISLLKKRVVKLDYKTV